MERGVDALEHDSHRCPDEDSSERAPQRAGYEDQRARLSNAAHEET